MRIGVMIGGAGNETIDDLIGIAKRVEAAGLDNVWMANIFGFDAIGTLALIGREVPRIGLGTAVTPTYPRHPTALAQQAMTTAAATGNRFSLGIGLSHKLVIEGMFGFSYDKPAKHMREYLAVLGPLLRGELTNVHGEQYNVSNVQLGVPGCTKVPVIVAALGPAMLRLTGEHADGTTTWMVGPKTMDQHIIPALRAGAQAGGRGDPTVVGGYPVLLTNKPDEVRGQISEMLSIYGQLPSYRAMLDREGAKLPGDVAILGDENALRGQIGRLRDMGVTDFNASIMPLEEGGFERTLEFLSSIRPSMA
jgi:F420-dependent oxidoreductase-like protein